MIVFFILSLMTFSLHFSQYYVLCSLSKATFFANAFMGCLSEWVHISIHCRLFFVQYISKMLMFVPGASAMTIPFTWIT